jgi:hypothetical protein
LIAGAQQLEENFIRHIYEISLIMNTIAFELTGFSMRNNKGGENSGDIVFFFSSKIAQNPNLCFR